MSIEQKDKEQMEQLIVRIR